MVIGGGKRKWKNVVGFAGSLAAVAGVELSVYRCDRRCHGIDAEELVQVWMGNVPEGTRGWRAGWGFLWRGDGEGFLFSFLNWVVRVFCPTKNFGGDGLLERTVCDWRSRQNESHCTRFQFWELCVMDVVPPSWFIGPVCNFYQILTKYLTKKCLCMSPKIISLNTMFKYTSKDIIFVDLH